MKNASARSKGFIYLLVYSFIVSTASIAAKIGLQQNVSPVELLGVRFVLAIALLWAYFLCFRRDAVRIDRAGLRECMVGRILFFAGVQLAGSQQAALLSPLDILLTVFWAVLLLGESLSPQQWVGTFFVIASVALGAKAKSAPVLPQTTKATPKVTHVPSEVG